MDDAAPWPAEGSDGVAASSAAPLPECIGQAVELNYDFGGVSGYAFVRRKADVALPRNYEIRFRMRGSGGRNDLQMKLTDGDNVWWKVWRNAAAAGRVAGGRHSRPAKSASPGDQARTRSCATPTGSSSSSRAIAMAGAGTMAIDDLRIIALARRPTAPAVVEDRAQRRALPRWPRQVRAVPYPRAFIGEQPYWTLVGSDGGKVAALIDEDAGIEPAKGSYSIAPVVIEGGHAIDWANVDRFAASRRRPVAGAERALDDARRSRSRRCCSPITPGRGGLRRLHADQSTRGPGGRRIAACDPAMAGQSARAIPVAEGRREPDCARSSNAER